MDACLDTLSTELYQVNTRVGHIAKRQASLGGFVESPSPSSEAPEASENDDDSDNDDDGEDGDACSSSSDKMFTRHSYPFVRISALKSYCMMLCMILCVTLCMT